MSPAVFYSIIWVGWNVLKLCQDMEVQARCATSKTEPTALSEKKATRVRYERRMCVEGSTAYNARDRRSGLYCVYTLHAYMYMYTVYICYIMLYTCNSL